MAAFFQLLRDRIFGRAFIILPRQPEENTEEQKLLSDASRTDRNGGEISETDNDAKSNVDKSTESISNKNNQNSTRSPHEIKKKLEVRNIFFMSA